MIMGLLPLIFMSACSQATQNEVKVLQGHTMGTFFTIKYYPVESITQRENYEKEVETGVHQVLKEVNRLMSTYIKDSEISRFNQYAGDDWFPLSPELAGVLEQALEVSRQSNGAFDITVGPLVNLWGFGPDKRPEKIPGDQEIARVKEFTGYNKLVLQLDGPALKKLSPQVYCDLSGIAKGYGVDRVAAYLGSLGLTDYLVEIGGEVNARGGKPDGQPWRLGIASPAGGGLQKALYLENKAMATSGDYHNYFEEDGVRYSHLIDPVTGKPITHKLASVTVIHSSCSMADALATAIDVLGPQKGYEFAQAQDLAVFFIIRENNKFIEKMTTEFEKILSRKQ